MRKRPRKDKTDYKVSSDLILAWKIHAVSRVKSDDICWLVEGVDGTVGCSLCCKHKVHQIGNDPRIKHTKLSNCSSKPRDNFEVQQHGRSDQHRLAVVFAESGCDVKAKAERAKLNDAKRCALKGDWPPGTPTPNAWWKLIVAARTNASASLVAGLNAVDKVTSAIGGFCSGLAVRKGWWCQGEATRDVSRRELLRCGDISFSVDERKQFDDFSFRGCTDELRVIRGHFGVSSHGARNDDVDCKASHPDDVASQKKCKRYAEEFNNVLRAFCTRGLCTSSEFPCKGEFDEELHKHIKRNMSSGVADGALTAQQGVRLIAAESCRNCVLCTRDTDHEIQRTFDKVTEEDQAWKEIENQWLTKKNSFVKRINYATNTPLRWHVAQRHQIKTHGAQGWGVSTVFESMDFALHRFDHKVNPFEIICLTLLACLMTMCAEAKEMSLQKEVRDAQLATLSKVDNPHCLTMSVTVDRMQCDRRLVHDLEQKNTNAASKPRRIRSYMEETDALILKSGCLREDAKSTFTHAVLSQMDLNPVFIANEVAVTLSGGDVGNLAWVKSTMAHAQATCRAIHSALKEVISDSRIENCFEAFDIHYHHELRSKPAAEKDAENLRLKKCFNRLCDVRRVHRCPDQFVIVLHFVLGRYEKELKSNDNAEITDTVRLFGIIRVGFEEALCCHPHCHKVLELKVIISIFFSFAGESCVNERNHSTISLHAKIRGSKNLQTLNDIVQIVQFGPSEKEVVDVDERGEAKGGSHSIASNSIWMSSFGAKWGVMTKVRKDRGSKRVVKWIRRPVKRKFSQLQFQQVSKLVTLARRKQRLDAVKSWFGPDIKMFQDSEPGESLTGCSAKQVQWLQRYKNCGLAKLRCTEEKLRGKQYNIFRGSSAAQKARKNLADKLNMQRVQDHQTRKSSWKSCKKIWMPKAQGLDFNGTTFENVSSVYRCDAIAVKNFAEVRELQTVKNSKSQNVGILPFGLLAARLLGKRVCAPKLFQVEKYSKLPAESSLVFPALPLKTKADLYLTPTFEARHANVAQLVRHCAGIPGSKWKIVCKDVHDSLAKKAPVSTHRIDGYSDLSSVVTSAPNHVDRLRSGRGKFCKV